MTLPLDQLTVPARMPEPDEALPVIDLGPYLAGVPGAIDTVAEQLSDACRTIGFHLIVNHGVPQPVIDRVFAESMRFHALPIERKMEIKVDVDTIGYMPMEGGISRNAAQTGLSKPNLNESFFMRNELPPDHPSMAPGKPPRAPNRWPRDLPGFREGVCDYFDALEALGHRLLPAYAAALAMPPDFFDQAFENDRSTLRLAHYPAQPAAAGQFGSAPHTDGSFLTFLAQARVPGLEVYSRKGTWLVAPAIEGALLVNSGDLLARWTNDRFLSTPHRVINSSGSDRFSIPFFFNPDLEARIECVPSCIDAEHPARYQPTTFYEVYTRTRFRYTDDAKARQETAAAG